MRSCLSVARCAAATCLGVQLAELQCIDMAARIRYLEAKPSWLLCWCAQVAAQEAAKAATAAHEEAILVRRASACRVQQSVGEPVHGSCWACGWSGPNTVLTLFPAGVLFAVAGAEVGRPAS